MLSSSSSISINLAPSRFFNWTPLLNYHHQPHNHRQHHNQSQHVSSDAIAVNAMVGPRSWTGLFSRSRRSEKYAEYPLSPMQELRLLRLQERLQVPFDVTRPDHQEALKAFWHAAFPDIALSGLISEQWKELGWQGPNPSTDFRSCGVIALENLIFFARTYPASFRRLLFKQGGRRATWEYPFAVAGINISFMLIQLLDLWSARPRCLPGINFVKLLGGCSASNAYAVGKRTIFRRYSGDTRFTSL